MLTIASVMFNRDTGDYKFTLVYYTQRVGGIPVYQADLRLLVRNESGFPLVLASSGLRDLAGFTPNAAAGYDATNGLTARVRRGHKKLTTTSSAQVHCRIVPVGFRTRAAPPKHEPLPPIAPHRS